MINHCNKPGACCDYRLSILLAMLVSLLVITGWYFTHQESVAMPVISEECVSPTSAITLHRPPTAPVVSMDRLP